MISEERIWELAKDHDTSKGTPVGNAVIAIRQALKEDRESIIRMIEEKHMNQINSPANHNYYKVLARQLREKL